ncbi:MAG: adenylate/guanylate cyclase domain-containing protein [Xanthobacteraceae bacterium]|nr:adenylate/guanylate cyclase domain-containing protein [Xanthobacteraceae bacterium]
MRLDDLKDISAWVSAGERNGVTPEVMMQQLCERLVDAGVALWRVGVFVRTLHPQMFGQSFTWRRGEGVTVYAAPFGIEQDEDFLTSPLAVVHAEGREVRYREAEIAADTRSSFFIDARAEFMTDYVAMPLRFLNGEIHAVSWTTTAPGGFSEAEIAALRALMAPVARVIEILRLERTATALLDTYVGNRAGQRILAGAIRRGHTETMSAAIWLSDMRGFTRLSDMLPPADVVEMLNLYFDCQVEPIAAYGGEVLKFMGDGLLAVFPIAEGGTDAAEVCGRVLAAARASRARVAAMTFRHGDAAIDSFRFGLALHVGEVLYGNIGGRDRLDFTCIGPAVNLAARLERIASGLNRTIVASETFAAAAPKDWIDLGEFPIAGFRHTERVYGLADETPRD